MVHGSSIRSSKMQNMPACCNEPADYIDTILTWQANFDDPQLQGNLKDFSCSLQHLLPIENGELKLKKVEPWNSVKVTLSIPKTAALKLKELAEQGHTSLKQLGIMAVQIKGDRTVMLSSPAKLTASTSTSQALPPPSKAVRRPRQARPRKPKAPPNPNPTPVIIRPPAPVPSQPQVEVHQRFSMKTNHLKQVSQLPPITEESRVPPFPNELEKLLDQLPPDIIDSILGSDDKTSSTTTTQQQQQQQPFCPPFTTATLTLDYHPQQPPPVNVRGLEVEKPKRKRPIRKPKAELMPPVQQSPVGVGYYPVWNNMVPMVAPPAAKIQRLATNGDIGYYPAVGMTTTHNSTADSTTSQNGHEMLGSSKLLRRTGSKCSPDSGLGSDGSSTPNGGHSLSDKTSSVSLFS